MSTRTTFVLSSLLATGLTVDVGSRLYDKWNPSPNGVRSLYRGLPARAVSRAWGRVASARLPVPLRSPLYGLYGRLYGVNFEEMERPSLRDYESLQDFFTRSLKPEVRPVAASGLACPVDGRVMACGPVDRATYLLPTVKDFRYRLAEFVGGDDWARALAARDGVFQIVLYLAPGDYHGFHAPADLVVVERRHFCGLLLPVAPWMLRAVPSLFEANERVVLLGSYADGEGRRFPLVYAAVGATNVGSVAMKFDPALATNAKTDELGKTHRLRYAPAPVQLRRGDEVGFFRMGSTVVIVFAADPSFKFAVQPGDAVKLGQKLNV